MTRLFAPVRLLHLQDHLAPLYARFSPLPPSPLPTSSFNPDRLNAPNASHLNSPPLSVLIGAISYIVADLLVLLVTVKCDSLPSPDMTKGSGFETLR